jgi:hypothetical protein
MSEPELLSAEELSAASDYLRNASFVVLFGVAMLLLIIGAAVVCVFRIVAVLATYRMQSLKLGPPLSQVTRQDSEGDNEVYANVGRPLPSGQDVLNRLRIAAVKTGHDARESLDRSRDSFPEPADGEFEEPDAKRAAKCKDAAR